MFFVCLSIKINYYSLNFDRKCYLWENSSITNCKDEVSAGTNERTIEWMNEWTNEPKPIKRWTDWLIDRQMDKEEKKLSRKHADVYRRNVFSGRMQKRIAGRKNKWLDRLTNRHSETFIVEPRDTTGTLRKTYQEIQTDRLWVGHS